LKIIIQLSRVAPGLLEAVARWGSVAAVDVEKRTVVLDVELSPRCEERRLQIDRICSNLSKLNFVNRIDVPGYRTMRPEAWS